MLPWIGPLQNSFCNGFLVGFAQVGGTHFRIDQQIARQPRQRDQPGFQHIAAAAYLQWAPVDTGTDFAILSAIHGSFHDSEKYRTGSKNRPNSVKNPAIFQEQFLSMS